MGLSARSRPAVRNLLTMCMAICIVPHPTANGMSNSLWMAAARPPPTPRAPLLPLFRLHRARLVVVPPSPPLRATTAIPTFPAPTNGHRRTWSRRPSRTHARAAADTTRRCRLVRAALKGVDVRGGTDEPELRHSPRDHIKFHLDDSRRLHSRRYCNVVICSVGVGDRRHAEAGGWYVICVEEWITKEDECMPGHKTDQLLQHICCIIQTIQ